MLRTSVISRNLNYKKYMRTLCKDLAIISNHLFIINFISRRSSYIRTFSNIAYNSGEIPIAANVVIVGGGIIGNSVAYHLASLGMKDVILLEQHQLTSGTTWHAAGLMVTFGSLSQTSTDFRKYSKKLYSELEKETGQSTGFKPVGFIELAAEEDRLEEYRRIAAFNRKCGVDVQEIGPNDIKKLFPLCKTDDLLAGFYVADDGRVNPVDATVALAKGARMKGVRIVEGVRVSGVATDWLADNVNKRVTGVTLSDGRAITAEYVVNCAGMWARQLGDLCGVNVPNQAAEHYYLITEGMSDVEAHWPVIEDPSSYTYIRPEAGGLMIGLFETQAAAWNVNKIPDTFSFGEIEPDWERMTPYVEKAMSRVPATLQVGIKKFFCGPESFTPDLKPILGEAPELKNYFVAAGMNSIGILTGGGVGRMIAHWIVHGQPDVDVTAFNIDRFHCYQSTPEYRSSRVVESLGLVYSTGYPYKSKETARGAKRSAFHDRLVSRNAYFRDVSGWEAADWFAPPPSLPSMIESLSSSSLSSSLSSYGPPPRIDKHSFGRQPWFEHWAREHRACREGVVVMDMSFMSKFLVQGRDAGVCLNRLSTANVDGDVDKTTYTQWLDEYGRMQADVTVTKLAEDKFMIVATDTAHRHVEAWAKRRLDPTGTKHVYLTDVSSGCAQLNLQGPRSRELMRRLTDCDMSNEAYPFRAARHVSIGFAQVLCLRLTYVGELGYELLIPTEQALHVYDRVIQEGKALGLVHAGLKALASLRLEKAYRDYGHDMDNTDSLLDVGLGFTADYLKPGGFIGKEATQTQRSAMKLKGGLKSRLVQVLVTVPEPLMYHGEIIFRDGICVGDVRAGSYGWTLGGAVGLCYVTAAGGEHQMVTNEYLNVGVWEVEIAGKRYPCKLSLSPMFDPNNSKVKA